MKKLISFGKPSFYICYPLVFIFVVTSINNIKYVLKTSITERIYLITSIGLMFFGEITGGLIYFAYKTKRRTIKTLHLFPKSKLRVRFKQKYQKKFNSQNVLIIFAITLCDLIASISNYANTYYFSYHNVLLFPQFLAYLFLSRTVLRQAIFRHHYVSIGINIVGWIMSLIPFIESLYVSFDLNSLLLTSLRLFLNSILYTYTKWLMHFKGIDVLFLLFVQGIFGLVMYCLILILEFSFCPLGPIDLWYCNDTTFFSNIDTNGIFLMIIYYGKFIIVNISIFQIIKKYSPILFLGCGVYGIFYNWVIQLARGDSFDPLTLVGYIFVSFAYSIYNEMIILHFWRFDFDTHKMIASRSQESELLILEAQEYPLTQEV